MRTSPAHGAGGGGFIVSVLGELLKEYAPTVAPVFGTSAAFEYVLADGIYSLDPCTL